MNKTATTSSTKTTCYSLFPTQNSNISPKRQFARLKQELRKRMNAAKDGFILDIDGKTLNENNPITSDEAKVKSIELFLKNIVIDSQIKFISLFPRMFESVKHGNRQDFDKAVGPFLEDPVNNAPLTFFQCWQLFQTMTSTRFKVT